MDRSFDNLDSAKRDRIINSALHEFSVNSYEKASTNTIVKNADISKGALFHYFSSKKELYAYLKSLVFKTMVEELEEKIDWNQTDLFERIKEAGIVKFQVSERYPDMIGFSMQAFAHLTTDEIKKQSMAYMNDLYMRIYQYNIDYSKFKDGIDIAKVITIVEGTIEKIARTIQQNVTVYKQELDTNAVIDEINAYMELFKNIFYKQSDRKRG